MQFFAKNDKFGPNQPKIHTCFWSKFHISKSARTIYFRFVLKWAQRLSDWRIRRVLEWGVFLSFPKLAGPAVHWVKIRKKGQGTVGTIISSLHYSQRHFFHGIYLDQLQLLLLLGITADELITMQNPVAHLCCHFTLMDGEPPTGKTEFGD